MIILRQKEFISQEYHDKIAKRVGRRALFKTAGNAALGGVKNAGSQLLSAALHPITTTKNVAVGVGGKIKNTALELGASFRLGVGKQGREIKDKMKPSEVVRRQTMFWSPVARKAVNIHDFTTHTLGKSGESWVESMANLKYKPLEYVGKKADEAIRTGAIGIGANLAGRAGNVDLASALNKTQHIAGGKSLSFNANQVAGLVGKTADQLNPVSKGAINFAGKATGYTVFQRPSGLLQETGKALTKGKEEEIAQQIEAFKNNKDARRAADYLNKSRIVKAGNFIARKDKQLWGKIGQGINTGTAKVGQGLSNAKSKAGSVLRGLGRRQPTLQPAMI